ncbi:MAG: PQQ-binding-like beta-propeller repeat protein [Verrucomicrobiaceae bacterium]|nr:PQQ-binding-like beta-propeller repeat protein [Verrucomicrobiaceae bacterium]
MDLSDLVFTAFNKRVAALHRETGQIVWKWTAPRGSTYTSLLLDGDLLIACVRGYMYALDARTGQQRWMNEMAGFGFGVASLASVNGVSNAHHVITAAAQQAAAAAAAAAA